MIIRAIVNNDEVEFLIEKSSDKELERRGFDVHVAKPSSSIPECIIIYSKSGIVKDVKLKGSITVFENDTKISWEIIFNRTQEALEGFLKSEATGMLSDGSEEGGSAKVKPYDPDKIKVRQDKYSVDFVVNKLILRDLLDLNPDFQRKFVWDRKRQSRLIESTLLGIPIPFMYLSESVKDKFHVVDGLQRLCTFRDYMNNEFPLKNLEHLSQFEGCYFSVAKKGKRALDQTMQTRIESFQLYFNIIEKTSPNEVKYDIFERLNTGGLPLNAQEIRNCNSEDHVRDFLKQASTTQVFLEATDNSITSKRLDDQELVLRYVGFFLSRNNSEFQAKVEYTGNMKQFLNSVNEFLNRSDKQVLQDLHDRFINSMKVCFHLFGRYAFRKCLPADLEPDSRRPLINKSMFIVWSVLAADVNLEAVQQNYSFGSFAQTLADKMQTKVESDGKISVTSSDYNKMFTTGTFDVKNLMTSFNHTFEILNEFNIR
jgi:hypothetical protein